MSKERPSSTKFACRKCKYILGEDDTKCPICGGTDLSEDWSGLVVVLDPSSSVAEMMGAKKPGRYAIKVR
ncbi:MAG: DNA-directed RNA polymerase, subunit E'' [Candidatus Methanomethyliaceae archaeon]|nr:DNA-directed RNA polymerase, subunit E'' [Candidatus Methanomethyliaceae archaeon]